MDALEAAKDVIRRKYAQLKIETAEVVTRAAKAETNVSHESTSASEEEKRIRDLSKTVSKKENELDVEQVCVFQMIFNEYAISSKLLYETISMII